MSLVLDVVLGLVLIGFTVRGLRSGFVRSVGSLAGIVAGGVAAALLGPLVGPLLPAGIARAVGPVVAVALLLLAGYAVGSALGGAIGRVLRRTPIGPVDRALGAGTQLVVSALAVSLVASLAVAGNVPDARQAESGSVVLGAIRSGTPAPVAQALDEMRSAVLTGRLLPTAAHAPVVAEGAARR